MKEEIYIIEKYKMGHRVDKQVILCLKEIFYQYCNQCTFEISVECSNGIGCKFSGVDECWEYFTVNPYRIVSMDIIGILGEKYNSNRITVTFRNGTFENTQIKYQYNNSDEYLLIKDKIEQCLKNYRLNYMFISIYPIIAVILTVAFIWICVYTNVNQIVYPIIKQRIIVLTWIAGSIISIVFNSYTNFKRDVFPRTEFRIGQNEFREKKNEKIRNFLVGTVGIGLLLGVINSFISKLLFNK